MIRESMPAAELHVRPARPAPPLGLEDRLVRFCNEMLGGLDVDVREVGTGPFIALLMRSLERAGLRIVAYESQVVCPGEGKAGTHGG